MVLFPEIFLIEKRAKQYINSGKISLVAQELMKNRTDFIYKTFDTSYLGGDYSLFLDTVYNNNGIHILKINNEKLRNFVNN